MDLEELLDPNETSWFVKKRLLDLAIQEFSYYWFFQRNFQLIEEQLCALGIEISPELMDLLIKEGEIKTWCMDSREKNKLNKKFKDLEIHIKQAISEPESRLEKKLREKEKQYRQDYDEYYE